jgi:hypothetical protein
MLTKSANNIKTPVRLLIAIAVITVLLGVSAPKTVFASETHQVRFTATYVNGGEQNLPVYYSVDGGAAVLLGTVNSNTPGDFSFTVTINKSVRVFINAQGADYHQYLWIDGTQQSNGHAGSDGLTYSINNSSTKDSDGDNDGD